MVPVENPIPLSVHNSVYSQAAIGMNPGPPCVDNSVLAQAAAIGMNAAAATFVDISVYDQAAGNMNPAPCVDSSEDGQAAIDSPAAAPCVDNAVYAQVAVDINPATFLDSSVHVVAAFDSLAPCLDDPAVYAQAAIDMNPAPCLDDSLYAQAGAADLSPAPCVDSSVQNAQAAMDNLALCVDDPVYRQAAVHRDNPAPRVGNSISRAQRVVGARTTTTQEGHTRREVAGPMAAFQWRRVNDPAGLYAERQQRFMRQNVEHQRCRDRLAMQHRGLPPHLHSHHQEHSATARNCRSLLHRAFHMPGFWRPDAAPPRIPPMPTSILEAQYAHQLEAFTAWAVATAAQQHHPPGPLQHPISAAAPIFQSTQFLWAIAEIAHQAAAIAVTQVQYYLNPLHGPAAVHRNMFNTFPPRPPAPNFPWLRAVLAGGAGSRRQQVPYHVQHQPRPHLQQQQVVHFSRRAGGPIWTNGIRTPCTRTPSPYHHHPNHFTPAPVMPHYVPPAFRQDHHHGQQLLHQPEQHHVRIRDIPNQMNSNPNHMRAADLAPADQYPHPHELASTSQQLQRSYYDSHYPPYQAPGSKSWQKRKGTHMHILAAIAPNT